MNIRLVFLLWLLNFTSAQDANCDFYQYLAVNDTRYIYSPNYPSSYRPDIKCRWIIAVPKGYNCHMYCKEIIMQQSESCYKDRLLVSRTGDPQLVNAETICNVGTLNVVSTGSTLSIGLISSLYSTGGRFQCTVTPVAAAPPTPQCTCGVRRQNRIVGGQETGVNEFTMMAGLVDVRLRQIKCGGVIISERHVLTAAHCVKNQSVRDFVVLVGEHDVTVGDSPAQAHVISEFTIHPLFTDTNYNNDIAIATVARPIEFNDRVLPVCLPFKQSNNDFSGNKVTLVGWGTTSTGGMSSNVPLKVDMDVLRQSTCISRGAQVTDRQMCTFTWGKDSCQDDSGGPVLWTNPNNGALYAVGIISYGSFCASETPSINTRVTSFLDWVVANTQYNYCVK